MGMRWGYLRNVIAVLYQTPGCCVAHGLWIAQVQTVRRSGDWRMLRAMVVQCHAAVGAEGGTRHAFACGA